MFADLARPARSTQHWAESVLSVNRVARSTIDALLLPAPPRLVPRAARRARGSTRASVEEFIKRTWPSIAKFIGTKMKQKFHEKASRERREGPCDCRFQHSPRPREFTGSWQQSVGSCLMGCLKTLHGLAPEILGGQPCRVTRAST